MSSLTSRQAVIKEALRLHSVVSHPLERLVPKGDIYIGSNFLPEGTTVGMPAAVINRNENIFGADADTFNPERWLDASPETTRIMDHTLLIVSSTEIGHLSCLQLTSYLMLIPIAVWLWRSKLSR